MLFNKKSDEEFNHDFSPKRQSIATYSVDPMPVLPQGERRADPFRHRRVADHLRQPAKRGRGSGRRPDQRRHSLRAPDRRQGCNIVGNIVAEEVVVRGKVTGTIRANRVILQDSARVDSEIFHKKLAIEEGAVFEGQSRLRDEPMNADVIDLQTMAAGMKAAEKANGKGMAV